MSKYIDAEELKRSYAPLEGCLDVRTLDGAKKIFDAFVDLMPAADVQEVRHGRWIKADDDGVMHKCSVCGEWSCCRSPYCGECGAMMDEEEDNG